MIGASKLASTSVEELIIGPWQPEGDEWEVNVNVATVVNGFGRVVATAPLAIRKRREIRPVWRFSHYEERLVES